jgi:hypothetical protein
VAALVGISPKDELEGMIAAQILAAHNVALLKIVWRLFRRSRQRA